MAASKAPYLIIFVACGAAALAAGDNLQYWLQRATPATSQAASDGPASAPASAPATQPAGMDLWPAVVELSDGTVLAGMCHTTADQPWQVYVEAERRWRRIPPPAALSIAAVVREESYEPEWRWRATGSDEKVYTGRRRPFRRFEWTFRLADGSEIAGAVKGQPFWLVTGERTVGPFVLCERDIGPLDTALDKLIYVKRIIVSRRAMQRVLSTQPAGDK